MSQPLKRTPLYEAHVAAGARLVEFAGYEMPGQYADGVLKEHLWTRAHAGAFDVSHMGPAFLTLNDKSGDGDADHRAIAAVIEPLVSGDIVGLNPGQVRYTLLLNEDGGIIDDLMIGRPVWPSRQGMLYIVVNAGSKEGDFALIERAAGGRATLARADDRALIAVQGPEAAAVVEGLFPGAGELTFMTYRRIDYAGEGCAVARSGYTGEDGFEILVRGPACIAVWDRLIGDARVKPIGLGARDSLRLEAGLPLNGHDIDDGVSPIEANLGFAVAKPRLKAGSIRGADRIARELAGDLTRRRASVCGFWKARRRARARRSPTRAAPSSAASPAAGFRPP